MGVDAVTQDVEGVGRLRGELHPRQALNLRPGAGAAELLLPRGGVVVREGHDGDPPSPGQFGQGGGGEGAVGTAAVDVQVDEDHDPDYRSAAGTRKERGLLQEAPGERFQGQRGVRSPPPPVR